MSEINAHAQYSRSPQGERGLKFSERPQGLAIDGRSPQGERGLKFRQVEPTSGTARRSPQGERGLKFAVLHIPKKEVAVAPRKGSVD